MLLFLQIAVLLLVCVRRTGRTGVEGAKGYQGQRPVFAPALTP